MSRGGRAGRLASAMALAGAVMAVALGARAVITRAFEIDSYEEFARGELDRVILSSRGELRAGRDLRRIALDGVALVWSIAQAPDGTIFVGTGNDGRIYRLRGNTAELWARTGTLLVTSLAIGEGGDLYAGTVPGGRIFRIRRESATAPVEPQRFAQIAGVEHVWALAFDPRRHVLFAGTGSDGKIFAIDSTGRAQEYFDADDPHVLSLALDGDGTLYAGTADHAVLLRVEGPGRARALADFPGQECKAIALSRGAIYVAVNEFAETPPPMVLPGLSGLGSLLGGRAPPARPSEPPRDQPPGMTPPPFGLPSLPLPGPSRPRPGKGSVYRVARDGRYERLLVQDEGHFESIEAGESGPRKAAVPVVYVGSAVKGRILAVDDRRVVRTIVDVDERQVLSTLIGTRTPVFGTGDGGAIYRVIEGRPRDATYLSRVLDAAHFATWGIIQWRGQGAVSVETRSGNTESPDRTWSPWSAARQAPGPIASPPARFLQFRIRWDRDADAVVRAVSAYYLPQNQRAVVTDVQARSKNQPAPSREPSGSSTLGLGGGSSSASSSSSSTSSASSSSASSSSATPAPTSPPEHSPVFKITWRVDNPDNDPLRYRLYFRQEGLDARRPITRPDEVLTRTEYEWNAESVPDGNYIVEVEASDEPANPANRVERHVQASSPLRVDNRSPEVADLRVDYPRLRAIARDSFSPVARIEYAIDGGEWHLVLPVDEVNDEPTETVDSQLGEALGRGSHLLAMRAFDAAGNVGASQVLFRVETGVVAPAVAEPQRLPPDLAPPSPSPSISPPAGVAPNPRDFQRWP